MTSTAILYAAGVTAGALAVLLWSLWLDGIRRARDTRNSQFTRSPNRRSARAELGRKADHARRIH